MAVIITDSEAGTSLEAIEEVEIRLGKQFPDEYKCFILKHNGGRPEPCHFRFKHPTGVWDPYSNYDANGKWDWGMIAYFLSFSGQHETLFDYLISYEGRIPHDTLPIARDPGGNPILLAVSGANKGKVYFWMRENEPEDEEIINGFDYLGFVADSFTEFLEGLTNEE